MSKKIEISEESIKRIAEISPRVKEILEEQFPDIFPEVFDEGELLNEGGSLFMPLDIVRIKQKKIPFLGVTSIHQDFLVGMNTVNEFHANVLCLTCIRSGESYTSRPTHSDLITGSAILRAMNLSPSEYEISKSPVTLGINYPLT